MSFKVIPPAIVLNLDADSLTTDMIADLITFYSLDIPAENVEYRKPAHDGITVMDYPIIKTDLVQSFYKQLDDLRQVIIDIIVGNYHTDSVYGSYTTWGIPPTNITDLKTWVFFVSKRDFNEEGNWLYAMAQGNFDNLKPFFDEGVDLFMTANDHGDFNTVVNTIRTQFPFTHP